MILSFTAGSGVEVLRCRAVALFHRATITPTKAELIAEWAPTQPWGPSAADPIEVIGSYRFDDPEGRVGMETHLVTAGGVLMQVPLTYRDEPLDGAEDALITEMQHSVLGTRWVYDGLRDPRLVVMLAAVTMTGQGEALGMVVVRRPLVHRAEQRPHPGRRLDPGAGAGRRLRARIRRRHRLRAPQRPVRADRVPAPRSRTPPRHRAHGDLGRAGGGAVVLAEVRER